LEVSLDLWTGAGRRAAQHDFEPQSAIGLRLGSVYEAVLVLAGKGDLVEFMVYPGEFHYFDRSFVVRDAWTRVDNFFRKHLKPELATTLSAPH
jgi:dienelactone hydrolase